MREFLLASCPIMLWVIVAIHILFMALNFLGYKKTKNTLFLLSGLIVLGLFYDALILAFGGVVNDGALLKGLSRARFVSHGALIPLIFLICSYSLDFKGVWKTVAFALTAILIVLGIAEGFAVDLQAQNVADICRYTSGENTPAWATTVSNVLSYGTVVPLMIIGIIAWVKQKTPALFLSGFLMFAFSALGPATGNFDLIFYISMFGEICMSLFFYIYARHKSAKTTAVNNK